MGYFPQCGKLAQGWTFLGTKKSDLGLFQANKVCRIYEEYVLDIISSTEVSVGKGWPVEC